MNRYCDDCGKNGASLIWEGYCVPLTDAAPTYHEWQDFYLCDECIAENPKWIKYIRNTDFDSLERQMDA